jgi:hypothetical protein
MVKVGRLGPTDDRATGGNKPFDFFLDSPSSLLDGE